MTSMGYTVKKVWIWKITDFIIIINKQVHKIEWYTLFKYFLKCVPN